MLNSMFKEESGYDLNARKSLYTVFLVGVIAPAVFIVSPGYIQGMVAYLGFDEQSAGNVMSVELWGMAITTILMTFIAHRVNWRLVIFWSLLLMFAANALCTQVTDHQWFAALRFAAGLGAGSIISLSFAAVGLTSNPDRNFGLLITWVLTYGAIVLVLMPGAYATVGMGGVLWFFAIFPLVALPFIRNLPASGDNVAQVEADAVNLGGRQRVLALSAMFVYFAAQGVVWTYLFLIGLAGGLTEQSVATGLMFSQFAGIAGAFLAAMLGNRYGRSMPLMLGIAGGAVCLYFLVGEFSFLVFAAAVCIYNFAWNLTHPFLLAAMASFDRRGRVVVYAVAAQMIGIAAGPFMAASIIEENDLVNVNWLGGILFIVSLILILPPVLTQAKLSRQE